jgi:GNAT superfamily N-acetyltransferase
MPEQHDISVREFESTDLAAVKRLIHKTIDTCYSQVYPEEAVRFFKNWHSNDRILQDAEEGLTIVLEKTRQAIGTGTIVGDKITRVFVDPALQRRGFGKLIMRKLEDTAISSGIPVVKLDASLPSKNFYDSLGYVTLQATFLEVENGKKLDFYRMEKPLVGKVSDGPIQSGL